ncbi:MAG: YdeI/OmpD-associated family protein [Nocardioides sp.]
MSHDPPVTFDALLEIMPWGRSVYTVIKVPDELAAQAGRESTRRVEGSLDGLVVNVGLNRTDIIPDTFIYVGRGLQRRLGVRAGAVVRCVLAPADPDHVPVPDDVLDVLEDAGRRDAFERLPAPERRRLLVPVEGAARPATRERRIAALVDSLPAD